MKSKPFVPMWPRYMDGIIGWFFGGFALLMCVAQLIGWLRGQFSTDSSSSFMLGALTVFLLYEGFARLSSYAHARRAGIAETPAVCAWSIAPDHTVGPQAAASEAKTT